MDDAERVRLAREGLAAAPDLERAAERFALFGDPSRLRILFAVHYCPGLRVGDIAELAELSDTATSHALRLLRAHDWLRSERDGRSQRYYLADEHAHELLHLMGSDHAPGYAHDAEDPTLHSRVQDPSPDHGHTHA